MYNLLYLKSLRKIADLASRDRLENVGLSDHHRLSNIPKRWCHNFWDTLYFSELINLGLDITGDE